jgi:hypothetical protein
MFCSVEGLDDARHDLDGSGGGIDADAVDHFGYVVSTKKRMWMNS